jgi:hypothetical protein
LEIFMPVTYDKSPPEATAFVAVVAFVAGQPDPGRPAGTIRVFTPAAELYFAKSRSRLRPAGKGGIGDGGRE